MRELLRAAMTRTPIIAMLELDEQHGGMSHDAIRATLREADAPCEKYGTQYANKYALWGLTKEVQSWGFHLPTHEQLYDSLLFAEDIEVLTQPFEPVTYHLVLICNRDHGWTVDSLRRISRRDASPDCHAHVGSQ
jgi:hypothetical protein